MGPAGDDLAVELDGITKRFPGVVANDDVTLRARRGEIHAIVGENGAGKSTLMKILYGIQRPDEGTIRIDGVEVTLKSPSDAIGGGIGMVHQHFMLVDNFTVLENIVLGSEPTRGASIDVDDARRRIYQLVEDYGLSVDPDRSVADLGVGERQRVEILKVLYRGARILILDEPTAVLVPQEVHELFGSLRDLVAEGVTVLFISHKLDEVLEVADRITVIRAGRTVAEVARGELDARGLAELMVGSELPTPVAGEHVVGTDVELSVRGLVVSDAERVVVDGVDLEVHRGEIVGIAGVEGNGQTPLIEALVGVRPVDAGTITLGGADVTAASTRQRRQSGLGYIPQDRHREGLLLDAPLWENAMLGHQTAPPYAKGPWVDRAGARRRTAEVIERFDVRTPGVETTAQALSGGNQQKLIFGKEMAAGPRVLIAAQPTRGIDVGAQAAIWNELRAARAGGLAVLLVSADLEELIGLADTLVVMYRGRLVAWLDPATVTPTELGSHMTGARSGAVDVEADAR